MILNIVVAFIVVVAAAIAVVALFRRRTNRERTRMTTQIPMVPPGWASDGLTSFADLTRYQQFATFVNMRQHYQKIRDVDAIFVRFFDNLVDPEAPTAAFFLLQAHAAYRAAAGLAMSTQSASAFAVMRQCLENSLYGLHIAKQPPEVLDTWTRRDTSDAARQKARNEFTIGKLKKTLESADPATLTIWSKLYDKTIDFGAHPNPSALVSALKMHETDKGLRFQLSYLTKEPEVIRGTMKSVAQTGVCSLMVFRNVLPKRFQQLGIAESIERLKEDL